MRRDLLDLVTLGFVSLLITISMMFYAEDTAFILPAFSFNENATLPAGSSGDSEDNTPSPPPDNTPSPPPDNTPSPPPDNTPSPPPDNTPSPPPDNTPSPPPDNTP